MYLSDSDETLGRFKFKKMLRPPGLRMLRGGSGSAPRVMRKGLKFVSRASPAAKIAMRSRGGFPSPVRFRMGNAEPEFLGAYELDGLGKLKLKKVFKKLGKVVKKIAPVAAMFIPGVGPIVGPAVAALAARKKQAAQAQEAAGAPGAGYAEQMAAAWAQNQVNMAQQGAVQQAVAQNQPPYIPPTALQYGGGGYDGSGYRVPEPREETERGGFMSQMPPWLIPAAIAGVGLVFILTRKR